MLKYLHQGSITQGLHAHLVITGISQKRLLGMPCHSEGGGLRGDLMDLLSSVYITLTQKHKRVQVLKIITNL